MGDVPEIRIAFQQEVFVVPLDRLLPLRHLTAKIAASRKYDRIRSSVISIGLIEPLAVAPKDDQGRHMLLDGHLRFHAMVAHGVTEAKCIIADDDDSFTYNKRVNRLATVQEHYMISPFLGKGL